jgi:hypothetical protein
MGFLWANSIAQNVTVLAAAAQEIRNNADWVDDNKGDYCATHNATVDSVDKVGQDGTYNATVDSTDKIGQDGTYNATVDTTDKIGQDTSYRSTNRSPHNSGVLSAYDTYVMNANYGKS